MHEPKDSFSKHIGNNNVVYSQVDPNNIQENIIQPIDVDSNIQVNNQNPGLKKKNRTLQFYKFLLYAIKLEIKMNELVEVVRFGNQSEVSLWILGVVLYFNSPTDYSNIFVWVHIIHLVRGIIGFIILLKLPRSYRIVEAFQEISEVDKETKLFNDLAREIIKKEGIEKMTKMRGLLIAYFVLTFINFIFDIIDLFYSISRIGSYNAYDPVNLIAILISYTILAYLYLGKS
jgi:hypothetical protein